jgi:hypothetical protein
LLPENGHNRKKKNQEHSVGLKISFSAGWPMPPPQKDGGMHHFVNMCHQNEIELKPTRKQERLEKK